MKILALDSATKVASCCILDDNKIIASVFQDNGYTHSQTLLPMIDHALKMSNITIKDINYLAISKGPGSFTGLRIGASLLKGMSLGLKIPIIGVSTLKALAYNIMVDGYICPIMNARREQVYTTLYKCFNEKYELVMEEQAIAIKELIEKLPKVEPIYFLGDGVEEFLSDIKDSDLNYRIVNENRIQQDATSIAIIAKNNILNNDIEEFEIEYLRKPQAQRELEKRMANANK